MVNSDNVGLTLQITHTMAGRRIRQVLIHDLGMSRALVRRLRENDRVRLNNLPVFLNQFVKAGDVLSVDLDFTEESLVVPEPMDLDIVYEDSDFLAVNKPPGIIVHPVGQETTGTLANGVMYYWLAQGLQAKFRPIHRLDRNTSGLVLIGKNQFAHQSLYRQFVARQVMRSYLAVVEGSFSDLSGTINAPIGRKPGNSIEREVTGVGQEAITHYQVVETLSKASLIALSLETGRTHQIRVHLQHIGHPLVGDTLYGNGSQLINRQALHSYRFAFTHPRSHSPVSLEAGLPPDILRLLEQLRKMP